MVEVGSTIGNYEVLQKIGQGAMGAVYMARHPIIGKRVALKIIHPDLATNDEMVSRFFNEARAVTQIGHPNIVDVQDFGQTPNGDSFIVMELLEGIGLGHLIKREGQLSIDRAVRIAVQLTEGLRAAHARGIIHRDLKPDNIFVIQRGGEPDFIKILDFGLAKLTGPGAMAHKTRTGAVLGTAHYMAPEAAEDSRKVDHRVDVYALGCIVFEMLIGRVPFPGEGFGAVLVRQVREPPPLPSRLRADVPPWLEKIILHALAKKPDYRFASMDEFGRALRDPMGWERGFDDHEISDEELRTASTRHTPQPDSRGAATSRPSTPRPAPVRSSQLPADAKTVASPLPAPGSLPGLQSPASTEYVPGPASAVVWNAQAGGGGLPHDGTTELPNPAELHETGESSIFRERTASALGLGAAVLGGIAILGLIIGVVHNTWFSQVTMTVTTDPAGVEIIVGTMSVATSPAQVKLERGKAAVTVLLQKAGYISVRRSIEPSQDLALDASLQPEPKVVPIATSKQVAAAPEEPDEPPPAAPQFDIAPPNAAKDGKPAQKARTPVKTASRNRDRGDRDRGDTEKPAKKGESFKTEGLLLAPTF